MTDDVFDFSYLSVSDVRPGTVINVTRSGKSTSDNYLVIDTETRVFGRCNMTLLVLKCLDRNGNLVKFEYDLNLEEDACVRVVDPDPDQEEVT